MSKTDRRVSRFMTARPFTVGADQPLSVAHALMREHKIHHLPVLAEGCLAGLVSMEDLHLVETLADTHAEDTTVEEAMQREIYAADDATPVEEVAREMARRRLGAAVILREGRVSGIFTTQDALRAITLLVEPRPSRGA
jgi:CBS domain-containing protein